MTIAASRHPTTHRAATLGLAVVLALHGIAHFAGLTDALDKADAGGSLDYLGGTLTISDAETMRAVGVLWAIAGVGVVLSAVLVFVHSRRARGAVAAAALVSLALSIFGLWAAVIGVAVNVALLAVVILTPQRAGLGRQR